MQRLKTRPQFEAVLSGSTVSRTAHFALHRIGLPAVMPPAGSAHAGPGSERSQALFVVQDVWVGAVVPKRWAKRAVTRNAIKRQIYNVSASLESRLPTAAHVVRLRSGFERSQFTSATSDALKLAVRTELQQLFGRVLVQPPAPAAAGAAA